MFYYFLVDLYFCFILLNRSYIKAEEIKFSNGESSLFLINSRENKLLETQEKFLELKAKTIKTYFKLNWLENNTLKQ